VAVREGADARAGESERLRFFLVDLDRHVEAVAQAAVDLDDERERLGGCQRLVVLRPGLLVDALGVAEAGPELLGDVR
jgi:hypothetical protein